jgi:hypothetical protein
MGMWCGGGWMGWKGTTMGNNVVYYMRVEYSILIYSGYWEQGRDMIE